MHLRGVRSVIAARRTHRYANAKPWKILNAAVGRVFDAVDLSLALGAVAVLRPLAAGHRALHHFKRITRRRVADLLAEEKGAASAANFPATLLRLSGTRSLRVLYPRCINIYNLGYLDFVYLQAAPFAVDANGLKPMLDVTWNDPDRFALMCSGERACIILVPHTGFMHTTRAVSFTDKKIAQVVTNDDRAPILMEMNGVRNAGEIEVITVDQYILLNLSAMARTGRAIICAPDSVDLKTGRCDFLNLPMFTLAQYTGVPVYFVDYVTDERARLHGFIKGPVVIGAGEVEAAAQAFIDFCKSASGRRLTVVRKETPTRGRAADAVNTVDVKTTVAG
jgi:hypothetical protein